MVFGSGIVENIRRRKSKLVALINIDCIPSVNFFKAVSQMPREGERKHGFPVTDSIEMKPAGNVLMPILASIRARRVSAHQAKYRQITRVQKRDAFADH